MSCRKGRSRRLILYESPYGARFSGAVPSDSTSYTIFPGTASPGVITCWIAGVGVASEVDWSTGWADSGLGVGWASGAFPGILHARPAIRTIIRAGNKKRMVAGD